uniref:Uncharacterized protein n=1 Tax=Rhizophora mucronata TaxID=61149 RepID=A0A2P2NV74_RHIMU
MHTASSFPQLKCFYSHPPFSEPCGNLSLC